MIKEPLMFRMWGKIIKNGKILRDHVVCIEDYSLTRTKKVYKSLDELCQEFQIGVPLWLELNKKDFICFNKTRFNQDSFIDTIDFDYLEFQLIEDDY